MNNPQVHAQPLLTTPTYSPAIWQVPFSSTTTAAFQILWTFRFCMITSFIMTVTPPLFAEEPLLPTFTIRGFSQKQVAPDQAVEIQGEVAKGLVGSSLTDVFHSEIEIQFPKARLKAQSPHLLLHGTSEISIQNLKEARIFFPKHKADLVVQLQNSNDLCEISLQKNSFRCAGAKVRMKKREAAGRSLRVQLDTGQIQFLGRYKDGGGVEREPGPFTP